MPNILHYDTINKDAVGSTAGSVETVGTLKSSAEATDIVAFLLQAASTGTMTTGEALSGKFILEPGSLAYDNLEVNIGRGIGGAPATNEGQLTDYGLYLPFMPVIKQVGNKQVIVKFDALNPEPTSEMCAQASMLFTEGSIDYSVLDNRGIGIEGLKTRIRWSGVATEPDVGDAASEAFPESITVPSWVKKIVAIGLQYNSDAVPTAGEHLVGYVELTGTIPGLYPMRVPFPAAWATLGTTAEMPDMGGLQVILPMYIENPGVDSTVNLTAHINNTLSGVGQLVVTLYGV